MRSIRQSFCLSNVLHATCLAALFTLPTLSPQGRAAAQLLARSQTPAAVLDGRAIFESHYDPTRMLRLAIALAPPHPEEEHQFLEELQNKQSPHFHQYLSAQEWNTRFSPSEQDEQAVVDWALSQGLMVTQRYPNRLIVNVEAKAGTLESAFHVTLNQYRVAVPGEQDHIVFSNDRDPQLPANLAPVVESVLGFNSLEGMTPVRGDRQFISTPDYVPGPVERTSAAIRKDNVAVDAAANAPAVSAPPAGDFTPSQLWSSAAYDYQALMNQGHCCNPLQNPGNSPPESSIAVVAYGVFTGNDILAFATQFSLAYNLQVHSINGPYVCNTAAVDPKCLETTLDIEWAIATANSLSTAASTANVAVYEAGDGLVSTTATMYQNMLQDGLARIASISYGCPETTQTGTQYCAASTMQTIDNVLSQMAGQGWTLVAASGDQGATATCGNSLGIIFPASDPNVVAVGGTKLTEGSDTSKYEVAWTGATAAGSCATNAGGSTGGFSDYWLVPGYQSYLGFANRGVPDIALDAFYKHAVYLNGGWTGPGGTSIATPMIAGFFAQENAYLLSLGNKCGSDATAPCAPLGNANYPIYNEGHYESSTHVPFYDIVAGCNSNDITALYQLTPYCAAAGYDQVTGWGSANMLQLAWGINWQLTGASGLPYITFNGPATNQWYSTNQIVTWTVNDYAGINYPQSAGTGIAGFTQGWDTVGTDSRTEPHGGANDLFYSGPEFPNATVGCLSLGPGAGCGSGVPTQGCHSVVVHGWNNQGGTTAGQAGFPEQYGPLCYDSIRPLVSVKNSTFRDRPGWSKKPVTVTMSATDPGEAASGIQGIYFGINDQCVPTQLSTCGRYGGPFTLSDDGIYNIVAYAEDVAGNFSRTGHDLVRLDRTPPVTVATLTGGGFARSAEIVLSATDAVSGVSATYYQLDGGAETHYTKLIIVTKAGEHTLKYWSVDNAHNTEAKNTLTFTLRRSKTL